MQRVKLFRDRQIQELEKQVNDWLGTENVRAITISLSEDEVGLTIAVLYSSSDGSD
jgi:hypothetical protein